MYLKRIAGPRMVTLPDGRVLSQADLPPADTLRWVPRRKAVVVAAVKHGLITRAEALRRYGLSDEEFDGWVNALRAHGAEGLKVTVSRKSRQL